MSYFFNQNVNLHHIICESVLRIIYRNVCFGFYIVYRLLWRFCLQILWVRFCCYTEVTTPASVFFLFGIYLASSVLSFCMSFQANGIQVSRYACSWTYELLLTYCNISESFYCENHSFWQLACLKFYHCSHCIIGNHVVQY